MDQVAIEDYYHMKMMDENVNWMELVHLLLVFLRKLTSTFTSTFLIAFWNVHIREK